MRIFKCNFQRITVIINWSIKCVKINCKLKPAVIINLQHSAFQWPDWSFHSRISYREFPPSLFAGLCQQLSESIYMAGLESSSLWFEASNLPPKLGRNVDFYHCFWNLCRSSFSTRFGRLVETSATASSVFCRRGWYWWWLYGPRILRIRNNC